MLRIIPLQRHEKAEIYICNDCNYYREDGCVEEVTNLYTTLVYDGKIKCELFAERSME